MDKQKILITGSNGMLGSELCLNDKYKYEFICTSLHPKKRKHQFLDVTKKDKVKKILDYYNPDVIINCSAYTNVDKAENNKAITHEVNVSGLQHLIKYSDFQTKIVHISTDYVFDGQHSPYYEDSNTFPLNYYGKTKLEAENMLIGSNRKFIIIRPNVLFSYKDNNFFTFVYKNLLNNNLLNIVTDQISNPVYVPSLSTIILELILLDCEGIFHFGTDKNISRYDFALKIAKKFKFNEKLLNPILTKDLHQTAQRPLNTTLNCDKIEKYLDINLDSIDNNLQKIKKIYDE